MASYTGILEPSPFVEDTLRCSATIANAGNNDPVTIGTLESVSGEIYGSKTSNLPISMPATERTGTKVESFLDDYYYRIHVVPATFNLGAILSDIEEEFIVWNAYFESKECTAINQVNGSQIVLDGLTAPFTLNALGHTTYTITVPLNGDPQFETTLTFDFGVNDQPVVTISGNRITLFPFKPLVPMDESLEWLTNILQAKDGSEQRISTRQIPRQGFRMSCRFESHQQQARLDALLFRTQKRAWGLPVWPEYVTHSGTISAGATSITLDTTNADFRNDGLAVIWKSETENEVVKIATVSVNALNLQAPVMGNFTGAKFIMPCRIAQMNTNVNRKDAPGSGSAAEFGFIIRDNVLLTGYAAATTYKSLPVLTQATYVDNGLQDRVSDGDIVIADYDTGAFEIYSDNLFNKNTQSHLFRNFTKAACWTFRKFIHSLLGQQGLVWIPSFKDDMILADTIGSSDTTFNIINIGLAEYMGLNALRTHLAFIFPNGTMIFREILGITEAGSEDIVSIDSALGVEVAVGGCMVAFLDKYRLASDRVDIKWQHIGWNTCGVNFLRVKA